MGQQSASSTEHELESIIDEDLREPSLYRVLLHNDDYTTMDFVVEVLMKIFKKTQAEATDIMLSVHEEGIGVCGVYPKEIAEFRVNRVIQLARMQHFPLLCTMELEGASS